MSTTARVLSATVAGRDGIKGQRFAVSLTGCDVFAGPHGSGKSTRIAAVKALAACGFASTPTDSKHPWIGGRPNATVTAELESAGGHRETVSLDLSKTDSAKDNAGDAALIRRALGEQVVSFDLSDFEAGTDKARSEVVSGVLRAAGVLGWGVEKVDDYLAENMRENGWAGAAHPAVEIAGAITDDTAQWVEDAILAMKSARTTSNATQGNANKLADGLQKRLDEAARPERTLNAVEADLATARARQRELEDAETGRAAVAKAHKAHADQGERLLSAVSEAATERDDADDALAMARADLAACAPLSTEAGEAALAAKEAAEADHVAARTVADAAKAKLAAARRAADAERAKVQAAKDSLCAAEAALAAVAGLLDDDAACVHCGGTDPLGIAARVEEHRQQVATARDAVENAEWDAGPALDALSRAEDAAAAAVAQLSVTREAVEAANKAYRAAQDDYREARATRDRCEAKVEQAKARLARAATAHEAAEGRLREWQATEAPPAPAAAVEQAESEALAAQVEQLEALRTAHLKHAKLVEEHARAVADRDDAVERFAQVKATQKALTALRDAMARDAFGAIEAAAQPLLEASDLRVQFRDASDFGASVGQSWPQPCDYAHFAGLSGAQRVLVGAALAVAFARLSGAPWRAVILDDLQVIDEGRRLPFLERVAELCAEGEIQFVGGVSHGALPEGVNRIDLSGVSAKVAA